MTITLIGSGGIEGGESESRVRPLVSLCTPHPPDTAIYVNERKQNNPNFLRGQRGAGRMTSLFSHPQFDCSLLLVRPLRASTENSLPIVATFLQGICDTLPC